MKNSIEKLDFIIDGIKQGKYSLFLGAGISCDSFDAKGNLLPSGESFRKQICNANGLSDSTPLNYAAQFLTDDDREKYITKPFSNTIPGETYNNFCKFIWKSIYTLNVDDCIEKSYEKCSNSKQNMISKNYKDSYEKNESLNNVQVVHLHGFARCPEKGYVFDLNEYINNIKESNYWYKVFANDFATNPYIVSGISFNEPDFIYYVNQRNDNGREARYPSLLIEPSPNKITNDLCKRHNLILLEMTFGEFLDIVNQQLPNPPDVFELSVKENNLFDLNKIEKEKIVSFFNDFTLINRNLKQVSNENSRFLYGFEPTLNDIYSSLDIQRQVTNEIYKCIRNKLKVYENSFILVTGKFYSGKTTSVLSAVYQLALDNTIVFKLKSVSGFNVENAIECLNSLKKRVVVLIDNLSDYVNLADELYQKAANIIIVGVERNYRKTHILNVLSSPYFELTADKLNESEIRTLFDKYHSLGMNTQTEAIKNPGKYIKKYSGQTIGEYVCLLLSSFVPIQEKISKMYNELTEYDRKIYISVALAYHSYRVGIHYEILESILPRNIGLWGYFKKDYPLKLAFNKFERNDDNDYVVPENKVLSDCALDYLKQNDLEKLKNIYKELLNALSFYVNRKTIKQRTAEARLAGRLFDIDNTLKSLFNDNVESLLMEVQDNWEWNSRYWEQRALAACDKDINRALLHARQAVAIEEHPNTLTTLANIQFKIMENKKDANYRECFEEACNTALHAMNLEINRTYHAIQPLVILQNGVESFLRYHKVSDINLKLKDNIRAALLSYSQIRHFTDEKNRSINLLIDKLS